MNYFIFSVIVVVCLLAFVSAVAIENIFKGDGRKVLIGKIIAFCLCSLALVACFFYPK